jgi:methyl-accepting chemotaxis protein
MTLMKTTEMPRRPAQNGSANGYAAAASTTAGRLPPPQAKRDADSLRQKARTLAKQQQAAERLATASGELSRSVGEASSAGQEMKASMGQIAAAAEEGSRGAKMSLEAVDQSAAALATQLDLATTSLQKTETLQSVIGTLGGDIARMVANVATASKRQDGSVLMVQELEKRANDIGEIVKAVGRIADQTNLLALNAAIEAARAKQYGKGFAVVADEVRGLAEKSEKGARDIEALVTQIQAEVKIVAEGIARSAASAKDEAEKGKAVMAQLEQLRSDLGTIIAGAQEIAAAANQSNTAAREARAGAEAIDRGAGEQSVGAESALKMVDQQAEALSHSEQASNNLSELADDLKNSTDITKSAEAVAAGAEVLSSAVQEITKTATSVAASLGQISRGANQQAAATHEAATAAAQIEVGAERAEARARGAMERCRLMNELLTANKASVDTMIVGLSNALEAGRQSQAQVNALEQLSRRIDKIVDAIVNVSIQTSMLATNGSIEAARAGEYGKGFVVVSTDIRNLASESAQNADRIKDLVKGVQDQIATVRRELEEIGGVSRAEVEKAGSVTTSLVAVVSDMTVIADKNQEIARGSAEIVAALGALKKTMSQIAAAAEEASKAASESAAAAEEQSRSADELARAVDEIASLADELQSAA